jgi:hypothetical protein
VLAKLYDRLVPMIFKKSDKEFPDNRSAAFAHVLRYGLG